MYSYLKYLENPYLAKYNQEDYNPFKKICLSEDRILLKLQEINKRLDKILTKVSQEYENN